MEKDEGGGKSETARGEERDGERRNEWHSGNRRRR